jgi:hypothetical protein
MNQYTLLSENATAANTIFFTVRKSFNSLNLSAITSLSLGSISSTIYSRKKNVISPRIIAVTPIIIPISSISISKTFKPIIQANNIKNEYINNCRYLSELIVIYNYANVF